MSQETEVLYTGKSSDQPLEPLSWFQTWILALTRPSVATFKQIAYDPNATRRRAFLWIFTSAFLGESMRSLERGFVGGGQKLDRAEIFLNCVSFNAVLAVLSLAFVAGVTNSLARGIFHGSGRYTNLLYAFAAFYAPLYLIDSIIGGIPYVNCLYIPLMIYSIVLGATAIRAVHGIGWGQAVVSFLAGLVIVFCVVAVFTFYTLALLGPSIGDGFQNNISGPASVQF